MLLLYGYFCHSGRWSNYGETALPSWPAKPKIFTLQPLKKMFADPCCGSLPVFYSQGSHAPPRPFYPTCVHVLDPSPFPLAPTWATASSPLNRTASSSHHRFCCPATCGHRCVEVRGRRERWGAGGKPGGERK